MVEIVRATSLLYHIVLYCRCMSSFRPKWLIASSLIGRSRAPRLRLLVPSASVWMTENSALRARRIRAHRSSASRSQSLIQVLSADDSQDPRDLSGAICECCDADVLHANTGTIGSVVCGARVSANTPRGGAGSGDEVSSAERTVRWSGELSRAVGVTATDSPSYSPLVPTCADCSQVIPTCPA